MSLTENLEYAENLASRDDSNKKVRPHIIVSIFMGLLCLAPARAEPWSLRKQDDELGVTVWDRTTPDGYREFRGVTQVQSRLSGIVALFRDTERMPEWLYRTKRVETLSWVSDLETYASTVISMPWPFRDRDAVLHVELSQDPETLAVVLVASAEPDFTPEIDGYVRMPVVESTWRFTPLTEGRVEIEFSGHADPGGHLSNGLLNRFQSQLVWQSPYRSLRALHEVIADPSYQAAWFPGLEELSPAGESVRADPPATHLD